MTEYDLKNDVEEVLKLFPKFTYNGKNIAGEIDIYDSNDKYYSSFIIKISIPPRYPFEFPILYECRNDIPHIIDRHISMDGSCCVCVTQEEDIRKRTGITIKEFIFEYVIPFFANQIYFETNNNSWANGDYLHGYNGFIQYYQELFKTMDINIIVLGFRCFFAKSMKSYEKCFCGSNLKYRKCHLKALDQMEKMSSLRLKNDYKLLICKSLLENYNKKSN
jgi:hypothetical protein